MTDVEPCPRCGGSVNVCAYYFTDNAKDVPRIVCPKCGYDYYMLLYPFPCEPEGIIDRWNRHCRRVKNGVLPSI